MPTTKSRANERLGAEIRRRRKAAGLTQNELCAKLRRRRVHVTQPTISTWESGEFDPPTVALIALDKIFGLEVGTLLRRADGGRTGSTSVNGCYQLTILRKERTVSPMLRIQAPPVRVAA